jgi:hypothetical protein
LTKAEKELYGKIARLGCSLCRHLGYGETPAEIHHIRKNATKRNLSPVIPLCREHHRGDTGVHALGKKGKFEARYGIDEQTLLDQTNVLLESNFG